MTSGSRMVWAAIYGEQRGLGKSVAESVRRAAMEVKNLGSLAGQRYLFVDDEDARVMLDDMLGVPR